MASGVTPYVADNDFTEDAFAVVDQCTVEDDTSSTYGSLSAPYGLGQRYVSCAVECCVIMVS